LELAYRRNGRLCKQRKCYKSRTKEKEFKQLQKEKEELEKQAADIAKRQAELEIKIKILRSRLRIFSVVIFDS
jgi:septal ring factor EnvC (AmiA/AmiB activator)